MPMKVIFGLKIVESSIWAKFCLFPTDFGLFRSQKCLTIHGQNLVIPAIVLSVIFASTNLEETKIFYYK